MEPLVDVVVADHPVSEESETLLAPEPVAVLTAFSPHPTSGPSEAQSRPVARRKSRPGPKSIKVKEDEEVIGRLSVGLKVGKKRSSLPLVFKPIKNLIKDDGMNSTLTNHSELFPVAESIVVTSPSKSSSRKRQLSKGNQENEIPNASLTLQKIISPLKSLENNRKRQSFVGHRVNEINERKRQSIVGNEENEIPNDLVHLKRRKTIGSESLPWIRLDLFSK